MLLRLAVLVWRLRLAADEPRWRAAFFRVELDGISQSRQHGVVSGLELVKVESGEAVGITKHVGLELCPECSRACPFLPVG